jgi:hypothetical protein
MTTVVNELEEVAKTEELQGNTEVSDEITELADTSETVTSETVEAIDEIETRPTWKTTLLGPDYKNLGQLRSALAHNDNAIRKLTKTFGEVTTESTAGIQTQLSTLLEEFSLLGWVSRFLLGYKPLPAEEPNPTLTPTPVPTVPESTESTPSVTVSPTPEPSGTEIPTPTPSPTTTTINMPTN